MEWLGSQSPSVRQEFEVCETAADYQAGFATTLGLAAVALTDNPAFPTYPSAPSQADISSGLAAAYAASAMLGKSGAVALLIVLFMAVTSCASAELIAVSSILTFDIYKTYLKPAATPSNLIFVSHIMICVFGLTMAIFAVIWNAIGIDLGWLFLVMGLLIGGAVFPAAFAITWKRQTKAGAISGAIGGLCAGLIAWLVEAKVYYGELSITSTGMEYPTLAGNLAAIMTGLILSVVVSLFRPDNFDWEVTRSINASTAPTLPGRAFSDAEEKEASSEPSPTDSPPAADAEKTDFKGVSTTPSEPLPVTASSQLPTIQRELSEELHDLTEESDPQSPALRSAFRLACLASILLPFIMDFLIPIPMFLSHYIFSEGFFTAWVIVSFVWVFSSAAISIVLPVWEVRGFLSGLAGEIFGGRGSSR